MVAVSEPFIVMYDLEYFSARYIDSRELALPISLLGLSVFVLCNINHRCNNTQHIRSQAAENWASRSLCQTYNKQLTG